MSKNKQLVGIYYGEKYKDEIIYDEGKYKRVLEYFSKKHRSTGCVNFFDFSKEEIEVAINTYDWVRELFSVENKMKLKEFKELIKEHSSKITKGVKTDGTRR